MKPLIIGFSYDMETIFLVFATKSILFRLPFWALIRMEVNKPSKFWSHCNQIFISVQTIRYLSQTIHFKVIISLIIYQFNRATKVQARIICKMVYFRIFHCPYRPLIYVRNNWKPETKSLRTPDMLVRLELKPLLRYIVSYFFSTDVKSKAVIRKSHNPMKMLFSKIWVGWGGGALMNMGRAFNTREH